MDMDHTHMHMHMHMCMHMCNMCMHMYHMCMHMRMHMHVCMHMHMHTGLLLALPLLIYGAAFAIHLRLLPRTGSGAPHSADHTVLVVAPPSGSS